MTRRILILLLGLALTARADMAAQDARFRKLPQGRDVCPPKALEGMALALGKTNPHGAAEYVDTPGAPGFEKALRVTTKKAPEIPSAFQTHAKCRVGVKKGEVLLAVFWARAAMASEEAESTFIFELASAPFTRSAGYRFECARAWSKFYVPFVAATDCAPGDIALHFTGGPGRQTMEVGGFRVLSYGRGLALGQLPYTPLTYRGRAVDAQWRKEATTLIEKNRKAQLVIIVRKVTGRSLPWAEVRVRQQRHAYGFGSAVASPQLSGDGDDADMYREVVAGAFNKVAMEEDLQWPEFEKNGTRAVAAVQWLREAGIGIRGQSLLRSAWSHLPKDLPALERKPDELRKRVLDHVRAEVAAFKGQIAEWDVVNGPVANGDLQRVLGNGILAEAFKVARETDPQARLFINEGGILSQGGSDTEQQDNYFRIIRALLDAKAPVQGIGIEGRFDEQLTPPIKIWDILDRFAGLGLPIQITGHEINVWDEEVMSDYTRDFMTVIFAHPATTGIVSSGFWEKRHPVPNAAPWTAGWDLRAHGRVWYDLVFKKWWTSVNTAAGRTGVAKVRGFLGDYIVEVRYGSKVKKVPVKLGKGGAWVEIEL